MFDTDILNYPLSKLALFSNVSSIIFLYQFKAFGEYLSKMDYISMLVSAYNIPDYVRDPHIFVTNMDRANFGKFTWIL